MSLRIKSIRSRLIFYCVSLVLLSLFFVSSFFYISLSHLWREQDHDELKGQAYFYHDLFLKDGLRPQIVDGKLLVLIYQNNKKVFTHYPSYLLSELPKSEEINRNELKIIKNQSDEFYQKEGIKTLLLLDGDEDETWEYWEARISQKLIDWQLTSVATFIEDDFFEVNTIKMKNGDLVVVGKFAEEREEKLADLRYLALTSFFPCLLYTLVLSYLMSRSFLVPIEDLISVIKRIQKGEKNLRANIKGRTDELTLLKEEFNKLLDKNETLVKSLKDTLDNVAHDLKTPLTHFRMNAETALSYDDASRLKEALGEGIESSELILKILNSLMDIQEVESGTLYLQEETLRLDEIVQSVLEVYQFVADEKGILLNSQLIPLSIRADKSRLFQIVSNLLDNALKFSKSGTSINVSLERLGSDARLIIKDQGKGMNQEELSHIWERFYRGESSRHSKGAGIGLSLVAAYVKAHKWKIEVNSQENVGSTFILSLPICNSAERSS